VQKAANVRQEPLSSSSKCSNLTEFLPVNNRCNAGIVFEYPPKEADVLIACISGYILKRLVGIYQRHFGRLNPDQLQILYTGLTRR
jgi:hypothetical protein